MALEQATFGAGCFWCTEAVFQNLRGVKNVVSGYMGGEKPNPTYQEVCSGTSGHVEVIQLDFEPDVVSYEELLLVFFKTHDPTTLNKQGNDVGTQYRSVIFYHTQEQKEKANNMMDELTKALVFDRNIVTAVEPVSEFFKAEHYHQNYFNQNANQSYCVYVIQPKLAKFAEAFKDKIKPEFVL